MRYIIYVKGYASEQTAVIAPDQEKAIECFHDTLLPEYRHMPVICTANPEQWGWDQVTQESGYLSWACWKQEQEQERLG